MSRRRIGRRPALLLAALLAVLISLGAAVGYRWGAPLAQPSPLDGAAPPVATPAAEPTSAPGQTALAGGDLGTRVPFQVGADAGWLSITEATWTRAGLTAPPQGLQYLVITITVECSKGSLVVDSQWLRARTGTDWTGPGYGARLSDPLPHRLLDAGEKVSGQVGFVLPSGAATVGMLDEDLVSVAELSLSRP
jgi:hypothetical protein